MAEKKTKAPAPPTPDDETIREEDGTVKGAPTEPTEGPDSSGPGVGRGPEPQKDE